MRQMQTVIHLFEYGQKYDLGNVQMFIIEGMDKVRESTLSFLRPKIIMKYRKRDTPLKMPVPKGAYFRGISLLLFKWVRNRYEPISPPTVLYLVKTCL